MPKPVILQMGAYPSWDEIPLNEAYDVRRYFEATDKAAFLAEHGRPSAPSRPAASWALRPRSSRPARGWSWSRYTGWASTRLTSMPAGRAASA